MGEIVHDSNKILKVTLIFLLISSMGFASGFIYMVVSYNNLLNDTLNPSIEYDENLEILYQIGNNTDLDGDFYTLSQYNKNYGSGSWLIYVGISYEEYFSLRLYEDHPSHSDYSLSVVAENLVQYCQPESVQNIAEFIVERADYSTDECKIDALLTFCQDRGDFDSGLHYMEDGDDDFAKYPIETIAEGGGDCEDKSILFASLVKSLGYEVRIVVIPGHAFVLVHMETPPSHNSQDPTHWSYTIGGKKFYPCETTIYGWLIGDLPPDYQNESIYSAIV